MYLNIYTYFIFSLSKPIALIFSKHFETHF